MAYVLQSDDGASAVIGSKMVRAEICSLDAGSNKITSPLSLPDLVSLFTSPHALPLTKCNVTISHPRCDHQRFI